MIYKRNPMLEQARQERRRLLAVFSHPEADLVLADLERRFETDLPVFQGKAGCYDPLDAMRRDAHREIFLIIRRQLELARQEATQTQSENDG
ncbi:MAG: hypothetical protein IKY92_07015 [Akkermansia sp.]|nr:hypothetical protein [Akkermansia sp.]